jgi:hypothetical protein
MKTMRVVIMALSACVMAVGALVVTGLLVPRTLPEQFRVVAGVVVFLYGLYRFIIEYQRHAHERRQ